MNGNHYGVLKGRAIGRRPEWRDDTPHYQILLESAEVRFRAAIGVRSNDPARANLLYFLDERFQHRITRELPLLADGFTRLPPGPDSLALDYLRDGLFDHRHMRRIPTHRPGPANDLNDGIDEWVRRSIADPDLRLYVFGHRWGPQPDRPDAVFGFEPGNGIHDIHLNQGSRSSHARTNAIWQDGGLLLQDPAAGRWRALFLAFQSQAWRTDERGDPMRDRVLDRARSDRDAARGFRASIDEDAP
ncbi:MAG: YukJ family protein [Thermomicrobiales bacterium]|nr:YukJ family protein [Thermomicrobiales bacterium]